MLINHQTTFTVEISEEEAKDMITEINHIYENLVSDYHTPEEIVTLLTFKNTLVAELQ